MSFNKLVLAIALGLVSLNSMASIMVVSNTATKEGEMFEVVAYGKGTTYVDVGALGANQHTKGIYESLADDAYGQYTISKVIYCVGPESVCAPTPTSENMAAFKECTLTGDALNEPVNPFGSIVFVNITQDGCKATVDR